MILDKMSDFELVRMTNGGQAEAFSVLVQRYRKPLLHLSMRYVHNLQAAEDIVQDSFMKAFEKLGAFQFRSAFKSWIYRIVINTAKNVLRGRKPNVALDSVQLKVESVCEMTLIECQLLEQAQEIIASLPDKQKRAVKLRVFEDKSFKEVAKKMDCPYDTAKANYRHGLIKLKEKMVINW